MTTQDKPTMRASFLRREMLLARCKADFNRAHYSDAEARCWDFAAADALAALGGIESDWQGATHDGIPTNAAALAMARSAS